MKKIILLTSVAAMFAVTACADNDRIITVDQLPAAAQTFIGKYFADETVAYAKYDPEFLSSTYTVVYTSGNGVEFDKKGNMTEYKCVTCDVPTELLPANVSAYIAKTYPQATIKEIDFDRRGVDVKLSNRLELTFNNQGQIVEIDD